MTRPYVPLFAAVRKSTRLADLPDDSCRALFFFLLPQLDSHGRIDRDPRKVNAEAWPMLGKSTQETERCLVELAKVGLIEFHDVAGVAFIQMPDWDEKGGSIGKRDHRPRSSFPDPADDSRAMPGQSGPSRAKAGHRGPGRATPDVEERRGEEIEHESERERRADSDVPSEPARIHHPSEAEIVWQTSWKACRLSGDDYELTKADCIALNKIAKKHGLERLRAKADALLGDLDPWVFQNASPTLLVKRWSQLGQPKPQRRTRSEQALLDALTKPAPAVDPYEALLKATNPGTSNERETGT